MSVAYTLVTQADQVHKMVKKLARAKLLAVDTESNSLHAYREQVCLIQFTAGEEDFLVDPLGMDDLSPLGRLFADPAIETIFHAAEYDLIVLKRDFDFEFANLFDTMIAARILGRKRVGLGNLLEEEFGLKLTKRFQRANWGKRPLSSDMLNYARLDTHYLIPLRARLLKGLKEGGRWPIAEEDFARLPQSIPGPPPSPNGDIWRIKGFRELKPQGRAILARLAAYRNKQAEQANLPLFKIMGDQTLTAIAEAAPRSPNELEQLEGMTKGQMQRHGKALLVAVKEGKGSKPPKRPPRPRFDEDYPDRLDALRQWRKQAALEMAVESDVVLPRDVMEAIAQANPRKLADVEQFLDDLPWRRAQYSQAIHETLQRS